MQALRRRWVLALMVGLILAGAAGYGAWNLLAPKATATSNIQIKVGNGSIYEAKQDDRYSFGTFLRSQVGHLKSRFVLNAAISRDEIQRLSLPRRYGDVLAWLDTELKIDASPDSELVNVKLSSDDPDEALHLVRAITQTYMKEVVEKDDTQKAVKVSEFEKLYSQASGKLREQQVSLKKKTDELGSDDSEAMKSKQAALLSQLSIIKTQYNQVAFDLLRAKGRLEVSKSLEKVIQEQNVPESQVNEAIESDPQIKLELSRAQRMKEIIAEMKESLRYPEREPRYLDALRKLTDTEKRIETHRTELRKDLEGKAKQKARTEQKQHTSQLEAEHAALVPQEDALRKEVDRLTAESAKFGNTIPEIEGLKGEIERQKLLVGDIDKKLQLSRFELTAKPRVVIFDDAALMTLERKKQLMGSVAGSLLGLGLACMGIAVWEFRRRRIHSAGEVSEGLGIRVVGSIPASRHVERLINAPADEQDGDPLLTESIDGIRTQLLHASQAERTRLLMVTSAGGGEGKTTLASHLASSLARAGRKTLLIDGDLRQPAVHQFFEVPLQPGFSEVLLGEVETVDSILTTNVEGLTILPAGQWDRDVIASLARGGVQGVLEKLKDEYDFIVIDSHPVLAANDSLLIGQSVDAVILSVLREVSQTPKVYAAQQLLATLGIRLLGVVVNGIDPEEVYTVPVTPGYTTTAA
jgi:capsular exopolysaccharide synthesis family protein